MPELSTLELWTHLDALLARKANPDDADAFRRRLSDHLKKLDTLALARFVGDFRLASAAIETRTMWWAASLVRGAICEAIEFDAFRAWVIGHGRDAYLDAHAHPDALAAWPVPKDASRKPAPSLATLAETPMKACYKRLAGAPKLERAAHAAMCPDALPEDADTAVGWRYWDVPTAAALARELPKLWAVHGKRWKDHPAPTILREFVREADVHGLGRVRIGDELVSRHDGSRFTVLGISDGSVLPDGCDGEYVGGEEFRYIARVREEDGTVRCNQGLSGTYQRRPHEPHVPLPEPEPYVADPADDARDARDAAIQQRVHAALSAHGPVRVVHAAYDEDAEGMPIDNLDEIAHRGALRIVETDGRDGERFESEILTNPTWLDLLRVANAMIDALGYEDHVYLEGFEVTKRPRGKAAVAELLMGS